MPHHIDESEHALQHCAAAAHRVAHPFELPRSSRRTAALKGNRLLRHHPGAPLLPMRALFIIDIRSRELHPTTAVWGEQVISLPWPSPTYAHYGDVV